MKTVFVISVNGEFKQYLMLSEHRFIKDLCEAHGKIEVTTTELTHERYKVEFGK